MMEWNPYSAFFKIIKLERYKVVSLEKKFIQRKLKKILLFHLPPV